jgi:hypothetical protein
MPDFYELSSSPADCVPINPDRYLKLLGHLVHPLKTRHEIRPFLSHLSRQSTHPTEGDYTKALYLFRYLYSTPHIGCRFSAPAPIFCGFSDSAFAFHDHGPSSTANILCVGFSDAPFYCQAKAQSRTAPDVVASEYYAASDLVLQTSHFTQFSASLGWVQDPITIYMDSQSAINLANGPIVTKKARHMKVYYHILREAVADKSIALVHIPSDKMRVDMLTKLVTPSAFLRGLYALLNLPF